MRVPAERIHRLAYPQVPLIMAASARGRVSAMPVSSYMFISSDPPLLGVACDPQAYTYGLASKAGAFSLCVVDRKWAKEMEVLARTSGRGVSDKLAAAGLKHHAGPKLGVPILDESAAALECRVQSRKRLGDHTFVVAQVEAAEARGAFSEFWNFQKYDPILYTGWQGGLKLYQAGPARRR